MNTKPPESGPALLSPNAGRYGDLLDLETEATIVRSFELEADEFGSVQRLNWSRTRYLLALSRLARSSAGVVSLQAEDLVIEHLDRRLAARRSRRAERQAPAPPQVPPRIRVPGGRVVVIDTTSWNRRGPRS